MALDDLASQTPQVPTFAIVTKQISGGPTEDGKRRFHMTASSTIKDRDGDEIELAALNKMAEDFRKGVTIFMDHDFKHVESAYGVTDSAEIVQRGVDKSGQPIWDLDIGGLVNTPNPRALQLADSIDGGYVKLGASVTAQVKKHTRKPDGGLKIADVDLWEASVVGVASNQRSWAHKAAMAIKAVGFQYDEEEPIVSKAETETPEEPVAEAEPTTEETPETPDATVEATADEQPDPEVQKAAGKCPSCGMDKGHEGCDDGYHSLAEKSASEESTEGVQASEPETPETAPAEAESQTDTPDVEKAAGYAPEDVAALVKKSAEMVAEIGRLREKIATLETEARQQDELTKAVSSEVELAKQVIGEVMNRPLTSKTAGFVQEFVTEHSLFDPEVQEYLNKRGALNG